MRLPRQGPDAAAMMRKLILEALRENPQNFVTTYEKEAALPESYFVDEIQNGWLFLAEEDQGMIFLRPSGWVHSAYVRPNARGRGLGDLLVSSVLQTGRSEGMEKLQLGVFEENHHAVALYARHGFEIIERKPFDTRTDCVMQWQPT